MRLFLSSTLIFTVYSPGTQSSCDRIICSSFSVYLFVSAWYASSWNSLSSFFPSLSLSHFWQTQTIACYYLVFSIHFFVVKTFIHILNCNNFYLIRRQCFCCFWFCFHQMNRRHTNLRSGKTACSQSKVIAPPNRLTFLRKSKELSQTEAT